MDNKLKASYVKSTKKDYRLSFKLQIVREVESGELSATDAKNKKTSENDSTGSYNYFYKSVNLV